jgi:hypothetical protein
LVSAAKALRAKRAAIMVTANFIRISLLNRSSK